MDSAYYDQLADQELRLAAAAGSPEQRKHHLNRAAEFSTLSEYAKACSRLPDELQLKPYIA